MLFDYYYSLVVFASNLKTKNDKVEKLQFQKTILWRIIFCYFTKKQQQQQQQNFLSLIWLIIFVVLAAVAKKKKQENNFFSSSIYIYILERKIKQFSLCFFFVFFLSSLLSFGLLSLQQKKIKSSQILIKTRLNE